jgi:hypothetical protein
VIGGTVIIEQIFVIPGMGLLLLDAVNQRDYPIITGVFLVVGVAVMLINLVVDLSYGLLDPTSEGTADERRHHRPDRGRTRQTRRIPASTVPRQAAGRRRWRDLHAVPVLRHLRRRGSPFGMNEISPVNRLKPPSWQFHWFGTDNLGPRHALALSVRRAAVGDHRHHGRLAGHARLGR